MMIRSAHQTESYPNASACRAASISVAAPAVRPEIGKKRPNFIAVYLAYNPFKILDFRQRRIRQSFVAEPILD
jgi:hypothetical protein